ncbi:MAG: flagellar hook capping FlgD N-terminal domain-containing protein [Terracidiphilus sp.]
MASAIFHHAMTAGQTAAGNSLTPFDTSTSGTSAASGSSDSDPSDGSATISANDFLTLLVTEMQNQDPTADTDPNEYINQLVQVNSLEQLIDINQTLSGDASGDAGSISSGAAINPAVPGGANPVSGNQAAEAAPAAAPAAGSKTAQIMQAMHVGGGTSLGSLGALGKTGIASAGSAHAASSATKAHGTLMQGNLGLQKTNPASRRVGHALAGRTHAAATPAAN